MSTAGHNGIRSSRRFRQLLSRIILLLILCLMSLADRAWWLPGHWVWLLRGLQLLVLMIYLGRTGRLLYLRGQKSEYLWECWPELSVGLLVVVKTVVLVFFGMNPLSAGSWGLTQVLFVLLLAWELMRLNFLILRHWYRPGLLLIGSFAGLILIGTFLLALPASVAAGVRPLSLLDAWFTATSAVCVTGLIVRDTATELSLFGQLVVLGLIQCGGLGLMGFGAMLALLLGRRPTLGETLGAREALSDLPLNQLDRMVSFVFLLTLGTELVGGILLAWAWREQVHGWRDVYDAMFHSVSAFCNAGFSTYSDSLLRYRSDVWTLGIVSALIMIGGLGYPVIYNLLALWRDRLRRWHRLPLSAGRFPVQLTLHSRLTLLATCVLLIGGTVLMWSGTLSGYLGHKQDVVALNQGRGRSLDTAVFWQSGLDSAFNAVTARTAGFNSMPMRAIAAQPAVSWTMILLMAVGGSPSSTAGGMKTTLVAVLVLTVVCGLRGRGQVALAGRSVSAVVIRRAMAVLAIFLAIYLVAITGLTLTELTAARAEGRPGGTMQQVIFEVVSAVSTVGLSLDFTSQLSAPGRVIIICCMFVGRIGPMAAALAVARPVVANRSYQYATESVVLG